LMLTKCLFKFFQHETKLRVHLEVLAGVRGSIVL